MAGGSGVQHHAYAARLPVSTGHGARHVISTGSRSLASTSHVTHASHTRRRNPCLSPGTRSSASTSHITHCSCLNTYRRRSRHLARPTGWAGPCLWGSCRLRCRCSCGWTPVAEEWRRGLGVWVLHGRGGKVKSSRLALGGKPLSHLVDVLLRQLGVTAGCCAEADKYDTGYVIAARGARQQA